MNKKGNRSARMQSMRGAVPTLAVQDVERVKSSARMQSMRGAVPTLAVQDVERVKSSARMQSMRGAVPTLAVQDVERVKSSARMQSMRGVVPTRAAPTQRYIVKRLPPPSAPLRVCRSASRSGRCGREHGFGGGRRRAASGASEHRRVPTSRYVV